MMSYLSLLGVLALCSNADIHQNGSWSFHSKMSMAYDPWKSCPQTDSYVMADKYLTDEKEKFSCIGKPYRRAVFHSGHCRLLKYEESLQAIKNNNVRIAYVGDSILNSLYLSGLCTSEHFLTPVFNSTVFIQDLFLRNDFPCDDRCITNSTFRTQQAFKHPCWSCRDGIRKSYSAFQHDPNSWHNKIAQHNVTALVISTGVWYNIFQGLMNSTDTYIETLTTIGPIFQKLLQIHGIDVFWIGLPPHNQDIKTAVAEDYGYEWLLFDEKDRIAKSILEPYGVTFIEPGSLLKRRKKLDPSISPDGLHWW